MPERDADLLEVLIRQMAEDREINTVLGKALRVLGHAEFFEPVRKVCCIAPHPQRRSLRRQCNDIRPTLRRELHR